MKIRDVLGLNSRNHLYTSVYNSRAGKVIANSKLLTKKTLKTAKVRVPENYAVIRSMTQLEDFDFLSLPTDFVVKPKTGGGGLAIVVIERRGEFAGEWLDSTGQLWQMNDLRLHMADILAGRYSMDDVSDIAYIEERVRVHPAFEKYSYHGTPDIRVVVYNKVPVMSYIRLPTQESGGRANLFQGAAAVGIDMASGVTTYGVHHAKSVEFFPGTRRKLANIQIPQWEEILETAIAASEAIGLGYMASDIVLQPGNVSASARPHVSANSTIVTVEETRKRGDVETNIAVPMILEVNAQPGLKIQIANRSGLKERLDRVKGLKIVSARHGIRVAQALFADPKLAEKGLGRKMVGPFEQVTIIGLNGEQMELEAKIDTGADFTSIDRDIAVKLGLLESDNFLYRHTIKNSVGFRKRDVIGATIILGGRKLKTKVSVADRSRLKHKMLIGKHDLVGFAVVINEHVM